MFDRDDCWKPPHFFVCTGTKYELWERMRNRVFSTVLKLALVSLISSIASAQDSVDLLSGKWHVEGIFCSSPDASKVKQTHIIQDESIQFEPNVTIEIFDQGSQKLLRKVVGGRSCKANRIQEPEFLSATFAVQFSPELINGQTIYSMTSSEVISPKVNSRAFRQCGDFMHGMILSLFTWTKYPEYFYQEMRRQYQFAIMDDKLYMRFEEKEICKDAPTVMVFGRSNP
jgi:hypothetical protein